MTYPAAFVVILLGTPEDEDIETVIDAVRPFKAHAVTDKRLVVEILRYLNFNRDKEV